MVSIPALLLAKELAEWRDRTDWKNAGKNAKSNQNNLWEYAAFDEILAGYFNNLTPRVASNRALGK